MKHYLILEKQDNGSYASVTDLPFDNPAGFRVEFKITNEGRAVLSLEERINR